MEWCLRSHEEDLPGFEIQTGLLYLIDSTHDASSSWRPRIPTSSGLFLEQPEDSYARELTPGVIELIDYASSLRDEGQSLVTWNSKPSPPDYYRVAAAKSTGISGITDNVADCNARNGGAYITGYRNRDSIAGIGGNSTHPLSATHQGNGYVNITVGTIFDDILAINCIKSYNTYEQTQRNWKYGEWRDSGFHSSVP